MIHTASLPRLVPLSLVLVFFATTITQAQHHPTMDDPIAYAESAGIPEIASEATVIDMHGEVLREGTNGWTCVAMEDQPMCVDKHWMAFLDAYMNQREEVPAPAGIGIAYMLRGDAGASNVAPFDLTPGPGNEWVETGPHLMIIVPDHAMLEGLPTDPMSGGPYVMWKGTPYAHIMVPVEGGTVRMPHRHN